MTSGIPWFCETQVYLWLLSHPSQAHFWESYLWQKTCFAGKSLELFSLPGWGSDYTLFPPRPQPSEGKLVLNKQTKQPWDTESFFEEGWRGGTLLSFPPLPTPEAPPHLLLSLLFIYLILVCPSHDLGRQEASCFLLHPQWGTRSGAEQADVY